MVICLVAAACGNRNQSADAEIDAAPPAADACTELTCFQFDCAAKGLPTTSVSGTVFAPNGVLKLYGVNVYVPASDPGPLLRGVQCDRCGSLPGGSLTATVTDEDGHFTLEGVPATADVPIVIQVGKWRRQIVLPNVAACQDTALVAADTRLPRDKTEGDLPQIAITTGDADALECLVKKLGVADSEFTINTGPGAVHLYRGNGAKEFASGFTTGPTSFSPALAFWNSTDVLSTYDIVMLSCEGDQNISPGGAAASVNAKPQSSLLALHDYAGLGGRVFMSHWHNVWIGGNRNNPGDAGYGIAAWKSIITWAFAAAQDELTQLTVVDETVPKGTSFATWLQNVAATTTRGELTVSQPRYTAQSADPAKSERWVYVDPLRSTPTGKQSVQNVLFTTPIEEPSDNRCGKVVFSDMHVASGSSSKSNTPFPGGCSTGALTAQEKALAFIFFDISTCVGGLQ